MARHEDLTELPEQPQKAPPRAPTGPCQWHFTVSSRERPDASEAREHMDDASDPQALGETAGDRIRREREARERNSFCNIAERAVLKKEAERKRKVLAAQSAIPREVTWAAHGYDAERKYFFVAKPPPVVRRRAPAPKASPHKPAPSRRIQAEPLEPAPLSPPPGRTNHAQ